MATKESLPLFIPNLLLRFEDPMGVLRPEWRDYSRHNGYVNHETAFINGVHGMAARATISWGYQDPLFVHNYQGAHDVGMYRTSYHVLYPGQPIVRQLDNWFKVHPEVDGVPRVLDAELTHNQLPEKIGDVIWQASELIMVQDGIRPIIYSRYLLLNNWLRKWTTSMLNVHWYWLAQYKWDRTREHPGPPTLPNRVSRNNVIMHQTADKKPGYPGEVQSSAADRNRWELGNEVEMHQFIRDNWGQLPPTPPRMDWFTDIDAWARTHGIDPEELPPPAHIHSPE
jgi:hypothetical protein